ncbi:TPA: NADH-quinone oxidoreductase subunit NuoE [Candidatus Poribacteria bacterium]|nr:NADH-quinone oxidoreductase subunit NuoE [Candidatus Poribacteria bacterium]HEX29520.1 NADH-quinone oxidoreductase subunit NuoE [Candidatus Poribacteria bacterium]
MDLSKLKEVFQRYEGEEGALIPILQDIQDIFGYLPQEALYQVSDRLNIPMSRIYGVLTFYSQFYLEPRGRNTIKVCLGTACHVKGAPRILRKLKEILGIKEGETTDDLKFTLETVRCLGTCFLAPVMMINQNYYGKLTPQRVERIIKGI